MLVKRLLKQIKLSIKTSILALVLIVLTNVKDISFPFYYKTNILSIEQFTTKWMFNSKSVNWMKNKNKQKNPTH
jgi:hypothetical protein